MSFETGQKVVVRIQDPSEYARGAADVLDGRTGSVERSGNVVVCQDGKVGTFPAFLVNFDEPAPAWFTYGFPHTGFWFVASDLRACE